MPAVSLTNDSSGQLAKTLGSGKLAQGPCRQRASRLCGASSWARNCPAGRLAGVVARAGQGRSITAPAASAMRGNHQRHALRLALLQGPGARATAASSNPAPLPCRPKSAARHQPDTAHRRSAALRVMAGKIRQHTPSRRCAPSSSPAWRQQIRAQTQPCSPPVRHAHALPVKASIALLRAPARLVSTPAITTSVQAKVSSPAFRLLQG